MLFNKVVSELISSTPLFLIELKIGEEGRKFFYLVPTLEANRYPEKPNLRFISYNVLNFHFSLFFMASIRRCLYKETKQNLSKFFVMEKNCLFS